MWAYEMSNDKLVDELARACGKSGVSGSGYVIDVMASVHAEEARYFIGVVKSRLDDQKPPFRLGDKVYCVCRSSRYWRDDGNNFVDPGVEVEVQRVWWTDGKWWLQFKEHRDSGLRRFPAADFELQAQPVPA